MAKPDMKGTMILEFSSPTGIGKSACLPAGTSAGSGRAFQTDFAVNALPLAILNGLAQRRGGGARHARCVTALATKRVHRAGTGRWVWLIAGWSCGCI